jgi:hypothetical protein
MKLDCAEYHPIAQFLTFQHIAPMTLRFHGPLQALKDRLLSLSLDGDWEGLDNSVWKFKCRDRSGVLFLVGNERNRLV